MGGTCCGSSSSPFVEPFLVPLLEASVTLPLCIAVVLWLVVLLVHLLLAGHPILSCLRHFGPAKLLVATALLLHVRCGSHSLVVVMLEENGLVCSPVGELCEDSG